MGDIWTIKAALDWTQNYLERKGDDNPRISAQWLLSEATGLQRIELYARFDQPLSMSERDILRDYVARRAAGEPLQYITGEVGFRHLSLKVRKGVLIPRPETEVLVSEALALLPQAPRPCALDSRMTAAEAELQILSDAAQEAEEVGGGGVEAEAPQDEPAQEQPEQLLVADLCTGSGCIACSLAFEHPLTSLIATDLAPEAVQLAKDNAQALNLDARVRVLECDLGEGIEAGLMGAFDLIVSNPPYVPTAVLADIPREVADFEPSLALDGGVDGLDVYRRLLDFSNSALKAGGAFAFELHETCLDHAAQLASEQGYVEVRIVHDLTNRPRVLTARKGEKDA